MASVEWTDEIIENLAGEKALRTAISRGGDLGDLFWEKVGLTSLVMEDGCLEKVVTGYDTGASLRVVHGERQAFASTNDLVPERLLELAGVVASAVHHGREVHIGVKRTGVLGPSFRIVTRPDEVATEKKVELLRRADSAARAYDPAIKQVKVTYADRVQRVAILSSDGVLSGDVRTSTIFMVQVVAAGNGLLQVGYEPIGGAVGFELFERTEPEAVARLAAARAVLLLKADEAPSGAMPVVLSAEAGGTMIHEAIGHGLEADLAGEGLSVFTDRLGETVASPLVTVIDDATLPFRRGSFAVDDEGTPAQRSVLVDRGVLTAYMYDKKAALKANAKSTGNGRRESYRNRPVVRMTNTFINPGETPPESILAATPNGLFVKKMGGGQVNTVNGDFVFEVSEGYTIRNGQIGDPVRGATLTGNGPEILKQIDMVGTDLGFAIGTCGKDGQGVPVADAQPTLRLPRIVVGGRKG